MVEDIKLFEITCIDNTKVWCYVQKPTDILLFGTLGKGINLVYKEILEKIPYLHICSFSRELSETSKFISNYTDCVEEYLNNVQNQLIKAF